MHNKIPSCPNCGQPMLVTRLQCSSCETIIQARYAPCRFCSLQEESVRFLGAFVKHRGNLKEMERELGQSYWSLRNQLNSLITELGYKLEPEEPTADINTQRRVILEQLNNGEIDAQKASELLAELKRGWKPATDEWRVKNG